MRKIICLLILVINTLFCGCATHSSIPVQKSPLVCQANIDLFTFSPVWRDVGGYALGGLPGCVTGLHPIKIIVINKKSKDKWENLVNGDGGFSFTIKASAGEKLKYIFIDSAGGKVSKSLKIPVVARGSISGEPPPVVNRFGETPGGPEALLKMAKAREEAAREEQRNKAISDEYAKLRWDAIKETRETYPDDADKRKQLFSKLDDEARDSICERYDVPEDHIDILYRRRWTVTQLDEPTPTPVIEQVVEKIVPSEQKTKSSPREIFDEIYSSLQHDVTDARLRELEDIYKGELVAGVGYVTDVVSAAIMGGGTVWLSAGTNPLGLAGDIIIHLSAVNPYWQDAKKLVKGQRIYFEGKLLNIQGTMKYIEVGGFLCRIQPI